ELVIQAGIAGAFSPNLQLGEVVLIGQDTFADIGMEEKTHFTSIFDSGFMDANEFPFIDKWLLNKTPIISTLSLPVVKGITINKVSDSLLQREQTVSNFSPNIESMEGAAFHYVCLQEQVPFLQVRSISNYVGERDKLKWKIKEAIGNLNEALVLIIDNLVIDN
ncbi:MAG: futalosine hydrolase, partial [Ferruginibacter sp.]